MHVNYSTILKNLALLLCTVDISTHRYVFSCLLYTIPQYGKFIVTYHSYTDECLGFLSSIIFLKYVFKLIFFFGCAETLLLRAGKA